MFVLRIRKKLGVDVIQTVRGLGCICSLRPMRANSLALRLFIWATVWTVAVLIITLASRLSTLYRHAVERAADRRLDVYLRTLVADVASPEEGGDKFPQSIGEPLFELPLSGVVLAVVTRLDTKKTESAFLSRSLWDSALPRLPNAGAATVSEALEGYAEGPEDQKLRIVERNIDLGDDGAEVSGFPWPATRRKSTTRARSFDRAIGATFLALTVALRDNGAASAFSALHRSSAFRRASRPSAPAAPSGLKSEFPVEIAPLARETNALLEANREIVERARTHVGNLAHALKTPLSVIVNEGDNSAATIR